MLRSGEKLIVIGPTPPPFHGVTVMTPRVVSVVRSLGLLTSHLDTRDSRPIATTGRLDPRNVWLGLKHAAQLVGLLARHRRTAVYLPLSQGTWGFVRDAVFIWIAALLRRRVIVHLHGGLFREFAASGGRVQRAVIAATMRRVDEAWVLTPAQETVFEGLVPSSRIRVLQNTADDIGARIGRGEDEGPTTRLLYLSTLDPRKGCIDLLDSLALLGERARGLEVRFAGEAESPVLDELRRRSGRLAEGGVTVRYDGVLAGRDKLAAFAWAQVFALPTRYPPEGQPVALLEAMSAGLAVVTTDYAGIPCTVRHGREGLLLPPGDAEALAGALGRLVDDRELRRRLGAAARRRYEEAYRPDVFRESLAALLRGSRAG